MANLYSTGVPSIYVSPHFSFYATCAKELHDCLFPLSGSYSSDRKSDFLDWIYTRIDYYGFESDFDFVVESSTDISLSLDMARELSRIERSTIGRDIRRHFIAFEAQLNQCHKLLSQGIGVLSKGGDEVESLFYPHRVKPLDLDSGKVRLTIIDPKPLLKAITLYQEISVLYLTHKQRMQPAWMDAILVSLKRDHGVLILDELLFQNTWKPST